MASSTSAVVRLQSWKEIARYLGVGVRTAQLWERDRGLPVHRLPGPRGPVYADVEELERWRRAAPPPLAQPAVAAQRRIPPWAWVVPAVVGGLAWWAWPSPRAVALRPVPLTTDMFARGHSLSPDGARVAFVANDGSSATLIVQRVTDGARIVLARNVLPESFARWSPDGAVIAFTRATTDGVNVLMIPTQGGVERVVAHLRGTDRALNALDTLSLAWMPDNAALIVADRAGPEQRFVLTRILLSSGEHQALTTPPSGTPGDTQAAVALDGSVAFVRHTTYSESDLYVLHGDQPVRLTRDFTKIDGLVWLPDGSGIVFGSSRGGGRKSLWHYNMKDGVLTRWAGIEGITNYPSIVRTPTGKTLLAYTFQVRDVNLWTQSRHGTSVRVTHSTWMDQNPAFSPDGSRLAFISNRSGATEVWVSSTDGSNSAQLTHLGGPYTDSVRWSPDGQQLVFTSQLQGNRDIYAVRMHDHIVRRLTSEASEEGRPSFSQDGQWVYFRSNRTGTNEIWKLPFNGGTPVQLTTNGGYEPFESPDGSRVFYVKSRERDGLWVVPTTGGPEQFVLAGVWESRWGVARDGVYFFEDGPALVSEAPRTIWHVPIDSGRPRQWGVLRTGKPIMGTFGVRPDGQAVAWTQLDQHTSELLLAELP